MFTKQELETIKWALYGELDRSRKWRDEKVAAREDWQALHDICQELQRLLSKTIKLIVDMEA